MFATFDEFEFNFNLSALAENRLDDGSKIQNSCPTKQVIVSFLFCYIQFFLTTPILIWYMVSLTLLGQKITIKNKITQMVAVCLKNCVVLSGLLLSDSGLVSIIYKCSIRQKEIASQIKSCSVLTNS